MAEHQVALDTLYARCDDFATGRAIGGASAAHAALLARLSANQRSAEAVGWTACGLERLGGLGQLSVWGVPPGGGRRQLLPDGRSGAR